MGGGGGVRAMACQTTRELTSGNALLQESDDWMRMAEAVHWSLAGCVQPIRSNSEMTSTMREARRTMIALQIQEGQYQLWVWHRCAQCWPPSPEESHLDGSTLRLVLLIASNEVVDEG